jgi:hypothetical protein
MLLSAHIDAGSMRMDDGHVLGNRRGLLAFFGHTFLQISHERPIPRGRVDSVLRIQSWEARCEW